MTEKETKATGFRLLANPCTYKHVPASSGNHTFVISRHRMVTHFDRRRRNDPSMSCICYSGPNFLKFEDRYVFGPAGKLP